MKQVIKDYIADVQRLCDILDDVWTECQRGIYIY